MFLFEVFLGWLYGHFFEYAAHRWVFHNPKLKSAFKHHYSQHHSRSRKGCMVDVASFKRVSWSDWEFKSLAILVVMHAPLFLVFPRMQRLLLLFFSHVQLDWGDPPVQSHPVNRQ